MLIAWSYALSLLAEIPLVTADTQVWAFVLVEGVVSRTWIVKLLASTFVTGIHLPLIGSVERG